MGYTSHSLCDRRTNDKFCLKISGYSKCMHLGEQNGSLGIFQKLGDTKKKRDCNKHAEKKMLHLIVSRIFQLYPTRTAMSSGWGNSLPHLPVSMGLINIAVGVNVRQKSRPTAVRSNNRLNSATVSQRKPLFIATSRDTHCELIGNRTAVGCGGGRQTQIGFQSDRSCCNMLLVRDLSPDDATYIENKQYKRILALEATQT